MLHASVQNAALLCIFARFCAFCAFLCVFLPKWAKKTQICAEFCKNLQKARLCDTPFSFSPLCVSPIRNAFPISYLIWGLRKTSSNSEQHRGHLKTVTIKPISHIFCRSVPLCAPRLHSWSRKHKTSKSVSVSVRQTEINSKMIYECV